MKSINVNVKPQTCSRSEFGRSTRSVWPVFFSLLLVAGVARGEIRGANPGQSAGGGVTRVRHSVRLTADSRADTASAAGRIGRPGLRFERNEGQMDARARFVARGIGYGFFVTAEGAVLSLTRNAAGGRETRAVRLLMEGASHDVVIEGEGELVGTANYFIGADSSKWRAGVRNYERVRVRSAWPGIDLVYYGNGGRLEYDFVAGPGADLSAIRIRMEGTDGLKVDESGDLILAVGGEHLRQARPVVYQEVDGRRREIAGQYVVQGDRVRFDVGAYDPRATLVIDPVLDYSTYLGGSDYDEGTGIAVDASGAAYVVGNTSSTDFPTTPGVFQSIYQEGTDVFVTKIAADGQTLVYSTYLGGSHVDLGNGIAVDVSGAAYVTGETFSTDFPTTMGAFQTDQQNFDVFVTKIAANGQSLAYSTYLGGASVDRGYGIAVNGSGNAFVTGITELDDFPTTPGVFQPIYQGGRDAFVAKIGTAGQSLVYSSYLGGTASEYGLAICVDGAGAAYVAGSTDSTDFPTTMGAFQTDQGGGDGFVAKIAANGQSFMYSTYLGGNGVDGCRGIAVDASDAAYVVGVTVSTDFPTTMGAFQMDQPGSDGFVAKVASNGQSLIYSTYLGGNASEFSAGIAVDGAGAAYVTGQTTSTDYPTTMGAFQTDQPDWDAFVTKVAADGQTLVYSTYLGGNVGDFGEAIDVDGAGAAYVTGSSGSTDFPTTVGAFQTDQGNTDAFVTKLKITHPRESIGVVNASAAWFLKDSPGNGNADHTFFFGLVTDVPLSGDWDGDGDDTAGVYRPSTSEFFLKNTNENGGADVFFPFGAPGFGFVPVAGDWNGDGDDTIGLYQPSTGAFFLRNTNTAGDADLTFFFGPAGGNFVPVAGDWDGDGLDGVGLMDPDDGSFQLKNVADSGPADIVVFFGAGGLGYQPITGDWDGNGATGVGLYLPSSGAFFLRNELSNGSADTIFFFGSPNTVPLSGSWNGVP